MRKYFALFLIALMAVSVVSAAGVVSAKEVKIKKNLDTPTITSPTGSPYIAMNDPFTVSWTAVKKATSYNMQFKYIDGSGNEVLVPLVTNVVGVTSWTYDPPHGDIYGRYVDLSVRVQAQTKDASGTVTASSAWSEWATCYLWANFS